MFDFLFLFIQENNKTNIGHSEKALFPPSSLKIFAQSLM